MCREVEKIAMEERQQGRAEAWTERTISAIRAMMDEFSVSVDDAMRVLKVPEADKETYRKLLNQ